MTWWSTLLLSLAGGVIGGMTAVAIVVLGLGIAVRSRFPSRSA